VHIVVSWCPAARLPRSNQGRKRQENLVAKMLRSELDEATVTLLTVSQLSAATH
jgi:hypothetical protein